MQRITPRVTFLMTALAAAPLATSNVASAGPLLDAGATYAYDDNLSNGQLSSDIKGDQFLDLKLSGGRYIQLADSLGLIVNVNLKATAYDTYSDLNNTTLGVSATLRKKFGLGFLAPVVKARLDVSHLDSRHDPRDRWIYKAGLGYQKRLNARLDFGLDYEHLETDPDHRGEDIPFLLTNFGIDGDVFDLRRDSLTASLIFSVTERLSAYGSYSRQQGGIVASTVPDINLVSVYEKGAFDPVFGPGVVAYRIEADTDIVSAGLSWALSDHASFNLGYEHRESDGGLDFKYDNNIMSASILYAY